jgi:hypothetical protein
MRVPVVDVDDEQPRANNAATITTETRQCLIAPA